MSTTIIELEGDFIKVQTVEQTVIFSLKALKKKKRLVTTPIEIIKLGAGRDKCFMCKHRFDKPLILPVDKPQRGKFQPRYNSEFLFHLYDTHGLPPEIVGDWVMGSVYGLELTEMGVRLEEK